MPEQSGTTSDHHGPVDPPNHPLTPRSTRLPHCAVCGKATKRRCNGCEAIFYCSLQCMKTDYPLHHHFCKHWKAHPAAPSSSHKLAWFFPVEQDRPGLAHIRCKAHLNRDGRVEYETSNVPHWIAEGDNPEVETRIITMNRIGKYKLDHPLIFFIRESFWHDGSLPNRSVALAADSARNYMWKGPVVVMRCADQDVDRPIFEDVDLGDLRAAVDHFRNCLG